MKTNNVSNLFSRNTKTEKHFGGGPSPCWNGEPIKMKVTELTARTVTLEFPASESNPMDVEVGDEYVVVFNSVAGDSSSSVKE